MTGLLRRIVSLGGLAAPLLIWSAQVDVRAVPPDPAGQAPIEETRPRPELFAGVWDYNPMDSLNPATGRQEQAPESATQRSPGRPVPIDRRGWESMGALPSSWGDGFPIAPGTPVGPTVGMVRETAAAWRDLLEIPEGLTISVAPDSVTFVDDLTREHTFLTDGSKQRFRLGASQFDARVEWDGASLRKDVEGPYGLRMTETYFLSPDARRLFVFIRMGKTKSGSAVAGADRVYDRVE